MYWRPLLLPLVLPQLVWLLLVSNHNPTTSGHCYGASSLSSTTQNTGKATAAAAEDRRRRWQQQQRQQQQQQQTPPQITTPPPALVFYGTLLNEFFEPLSNALVQFWHADIDGNYAPPGRNDDFQHEGPEHLVTETFSYFGTATTDTTGHFAFRTYRPGIYASRPITHIHYKVFSNTTTTTTTTNTTNHPQQQQPTLLLTSQFYFDDENFNGILAGRGYDDRQILQLKEERKDEEEHSGLVLTTTKTIVVAAMAQTSLTERGEPYPTHAAPPRRIRRRLLLKTTLYH